MSVKNIQDHGGTARFVIMVLLDFSIGYSASLQVRYPRIPLTEALNRQTLNQDSSVLFLN